MIKMSIYAMTSINLVLTADNVLNTSGWHSHLARTMVRISLIQEWNWEIIIIRITLTCIDSSSQNNVTGKVGSETNHKPYSNQTKLLYKEDHQMPEVVIRSYFTSIRFWVRLSSFSTNHWAQINEISCNEKLTSLQYDLVKEIPCLSYLNCTKNS